MSALYEATVAVVMLRGRRTELDPLRDAAMVQYALDTLELLPIGTQLQPGIMQLAASLRAGDVFQLDVEAALDDIAMALRSEVAIDTVPPSDTVPSGPSDEMACWNGLELPEVPETGGCYDVSL